MKSSDNDNLMLLGSQDFFIFSIKSMNYENFDVLSVIPLWLMADSHYL